MSGFNCQCETLGFSVFCLKILTCTLRLSLAKNYLSPVTKSECNGMLVKLFKLTDGTWGEVYEETSGKVSFFDENTHMGRNSFFFPWVLPSVKEAWHHWSHLVKWGELARDGKVEKKVNQAT